MTNNYLPRSFVVPFVLLFLLAHHSASARQEEISAEDEAPWNLSVRGRYQSKNNSRGVDLSQDQATWGYGLHLTHESGFTGNVGAASWGGRMQNWTVAIGFEHDLNDLLSVSIDFTHTRYQNDSLNAVANLSNLLSLELTLDLTVVDVSASYDRYFGDGTAVYVGASVSGWYVIGDVTFLPSVEVSFISQEVTLNRLRSPGVGLGGSQRASKSSTVSLTGLSGITFDLLANYNLGSGFAISLDPMYVISKAEISSRTHQFLWIAGVRYSVDF